MSFRIPCTFLAALVLWLPGQLYAQQPAGYVSLTGTVVDDSTGAPLAGAHVFIAVSMIGTVTNEQGQYRLESVPPGAHRLYVSILGYEPAARDIMLRETRDHAFDFRLKPAVVEVGEITVEAKGDKKWQQRLEKFTRLFIGETPNAAETKITNPEVLDFDEKLGYFYARAAEPLIIENRELGYRIQYFLKDFKTTVGGRTWYDGEPLYEELTPEQPDDALKWAQKRREAFMGSFRHFMLSALAGKVKEQGFMTYARQSSSQKGEESVFGGGLMKSPRFPIETPEFLKDSSTPSEKTLDFHGFLEIIYTGEMEDPSFLKWQNQGGMRKPKYQTSWIELDKGPALVDYKGDVLDPYGVVMYGYYAFERVGDELPKEYRP